MKRTFGDRGTLDILQGRESPNVPGCKTPVNWSFPARANVSTTDVRMLRRLFDTVMLVLVLTLASGFRAEAQEIRSPYRFIEQGKEISVFGGYFGGAEGQFGLGAKSAPMFGARFGFELTGPFGLEVASFLTNTSRDVVDPGGAEGPVAIAETDATLLAFEVRPRMSLTGRRTWNGLQPYIIGGVGVLAELQGTGVADLGLEEEDRFQFGTKFSASAGAGIRVLAGERLVGRVEFLANFHKLGTPGGFSDPNLDIGVVPEDAWVTAPTFAVSFGIRF